MKREDKQNAWEQLNQNVAQCTKCALCKSRTQTVFARGNMDAPILFVGEAPGQEEDRTGKPFVGPAGKLLDRYLAFIGLEEEDYCIANILKCRPPRNRNPLPEEEEACIPYLREQVKLIKPKILVCLGKVAANRIISPNFSITGNHGVWFTAGTMKLMATYHPSALLRDPAKKEAALLDFKKILQELEQDT